jgi:hypothetical protein
VPSADHHVLIVPRRRCPSLETLDPAGFAEVLRLGRARAAALGDPAFAAHTLGINGRAFQEVKQAHFHLTSTPHRAAGSSPRPLPGDAERPVTTGHPEAAGGPGAGDAACRACADGALLFAGPRAALRAGVPGRLDVLCRDAPPMPDGAPAAAAAVLETVQAFLAERGDRLHAYRLDFGRPPCGCRAASWFRLRVVEPPLPPREG